MCWQTRKKGSRPCKSSNRLHAGRTCKRGRRPLPTYLQHAYVCTSYLLVYYYIRVVTLPCSRRAHGWCFALPCSVVLSRPAVAHRGPLAPISDAARAGGKTSKTSLFPTHGLATGAEGQSRRAGEMAASPASGLSAFMQFPTSAFFLICWVRRQIVGWAVSHCNVHVLDRRRQWPRRIPAQVRPRRRRGAQGHRGDAANQPGEPSR